jgi:uncharacterized protein CbrC (UPF0167 family)
VIREIEERTPGFNRWQSERWLAHCADGMIYLGVADSDLLDRFPEARDPVRATLLEWEGLDVDLALSGQNGIDAPSAYVFRCGACGVYRAFSDFH